MANALWKSGFALLALGAAFAPSLASAADIREGDIFIQGTKALHCNVTVTDDGVTLDLESSSPPGGTKVGSVLQNCNKKIGYTLTVESVNCGTGTAGGKLISVATVPAENLPYSLTFTQPTTGGSTSPVTGLLGGGCTGDTYILARNVSNEKINAETSNVFAVWTANAALSADSYTDTVTITMIVK